MMASGSIPMPLDGKVANIDISNIHNIGNANLDNIRTGGVYFVWGGSNLPENQNGLLIVLEGVGGGASTHYLKQIFIGVATTNAGNIWLRSANGTGAWQNWFKLSGFGSGLQQGYVGWVGNTPTIRWEHEGFSYQMYLNITTGKWTFQDNSGGSWLNRGSWTKDS